MLQLSFFEDKYHFETIGSGQAGLKIKLDAHQVEATSILADVRYRVRGLRINDNGFSVAQIEDESLEVTIHTEQSEDKNPPVVITLNIEFPDSKNYPSEEIFELVDETVKQIRKIIKDRGYNIV